MIKFVDVEHFSKFSPISDSAWPQFKKYLKTPETNLMYNFIENEDI